MRWNEIILSDNTQLNVTSIAFGNGYYTALSVRLVSDEYHIDILYTDNLANEWTTQTIYNSGADPVLAPGIVFTGTQFVIPFTTNLSNSFSAIYFNAPNGTINTRSDIFTYAHPIHLNSVRYVGSKVIVCGTKRETDAIEDISGYIWYCTDPTGAWSDYAVIEYSAENDIDGISQAAIYDSVNNNYQVYSVAKQNETTNIHRIYTSDDLAVWNPPIVLATDTLSALPYPAFAYCEDYDAVALFLHGQIYISKAGQAFITIPYPEGIGTESIRAVTSDGTKFLASSGSDNQADLKVIYSSGDPTVATNWRVQTLAEGTQISADVKFVDSSNLFVVVAGQSATLRPAIYTALFAASEFTMMKDRVPTYPGRVSLTSLGQNLYNLAREDDPTEVGTKLSKVNLLSDDAALAVWNNTPPAVTCTPSTALEHLGNNAFHVGDILTTVRDLSTDENWLKCDGSEIDAGKYPALADLFGGAVVPAEWEKGGFIVNSSPGGGYPSWQYQIFPGVCKSTSYYGVLEYGQYSHQGYSGTNTYSVRYTNDRMSNGWNTTQIASWTGSSPSSPMPDGTWLIYPTTLSFVNNTWVCGGSAYQYYYGQQTITYYNRIWYCQGDIPSSFTQSSTATGSRCGKAIYGKGYYVFSASLLDSSGNDHPGVVYGTNISNMQTQTRLASDNASARDLVFADNTFVMLYVYNMQIKVIYCTGIPSDQWTTVTAAVLTFVPSGLNIAYIAPYWMIFYYNSNSHIPYVCYTNDLSGNWTVAEAPWYDGSSSYMLNSQPSVAFSSSTVMVLGAKNDTLYTWYGSTPGGNWKEIPATTELQGMQARGISYSGGEWLMPQLSGSNYYLGYRNDNSAPNLPFLEPGLNMTTYIKAKEGD